MLGLEFLDLQFDVDKAIQPAMKEEQIEFVVVAADLDGIMATDEAKIAAEFDQKLLQFFDKAAMQVALGMVFG